MLKHKRNGIYATTRIGTCNVTRGYWPNISLHILLNLKLTMRLSTTMMSTIRVVMLLLSVFQNIDFIVHVHKRKVGNENRKMIVQLLFIVGPPNYTLPK